MQAGSQSCCFDGSYTQGVLLWLLLFFYLSPDKNPVKNEDSLRIEIDEEKDKRRRFRVAGREIGFAIKWEWQGRQWKAKRALAVAAVIVITIEEKPSFLTVAAVKAPVVIANPLLALASLTVCVLFFLQTIDLRIIDSLELPGF